MAAAAAPLTALVATFISLTMTSAADCGRCCRDLGRDLGAVVASTSATTFRVDLGRYGRHRWSLPGRASDGGAAAPVDNASVEAHGRGLRQRPRSPRRDWPWAATTVDVTGLAKTFAVTMASVATTSAATLTALALTLAETLTAFVVTSSATLAAADATSAVILDAVAVTLT